MVYSGDIVKTRTGTKSVMWLEQDVNTAGCETAVSVVHLGLIGVILDYVNTAVLTSWWIMLFSIWEKLKGKGVVKEESLPEGRSNGA